MAKKIYDTIKEHADNRNVVRLKYIFVDSLDVDPTFDKYEAGYNYCKSLPGILEEHQELTPFIYDKKYWNEDYWVLLKGDLVKNFSDERMSHMREVAKVFRADKIERLQAERAAREGQESIRPAVQRNAPAQQNVRYTPSNISQETQDEIAEARRQFAIDNASNDKNIQKQRAEEEAEIARIKAECDESRQQPSAGGSGSKKAMGIVVAILILIVVVVILKFR